MAQTVLVVEDEVKIRELLRSAAACGVGSTPYRHDDGAQLPDSMKIASGTR